MMLTRSLVAGCVVLLSSCSENSEPSAPIVLTEPCYLKFSIKGLEPASLEDAPKLVFEANTKFIEKTNAGAGDKLVGASAEFSNDLANVFLIKNDSCVGADTLAKAYIAHLEQRLRNRFARSQVSVALISASEMSDENSIQPGPANGADTAENPT